MHFFVHRNKYFHAHMLRNGSVKGAAPFFVTVLCVCAQYTQAPLPPRSDLGKDLPYFAVNKKYAAHVLCG